MLKFWANCEARGEIARPIYAAVHAAGSAQPEGYLQGFSVSRRHINREVASLGGNIRIVTMRPVK